MRSVSFLSLLASCAVLVGAVPADKCTLSSLAQSSSCRKVEVRREWRTFSKKEKAAYIAAVNCLAKKPHSNLLKAFYPRPNLPNITTDSSFYDDMTYIHMDLTNQIHFTAFFLPWHRWYLNQHVTQLKQQCGYTGVMPYWDWTKDTASFNTSAMWDADPTSGLGTFGDPNNDYYISDGGFSQMQVAYPIKRKIRRQYTPYPYLTWWWVSRPEEAAVVGMQKSYVDAAINGYEGDFMGFQNATEKAQAFHSNVHMIMGGDMAGTCPTAAGSTCVGGSTWTPSDPIFFLHHAQVDRIWWLWQRESIKNFFAFKGGSNMTYTDPAFPNGYPPWVSINDLMPTGGLFPQKSILSVFNTLDGDLCYRYE